MAGIWFGAFARRQLQRERRKGESRSGESEQRSAGSACLHCYSTMSHPCAHTTQPWIIQSTNQHARLLYHTHTVTSDLQPLKASPDSRGPRPRPEEAKIEDGARREVKCLKSLTTLHNDKGILMKNTLFSMTAVHIIQTFCSPCGCWEGSPKLGNFWRPWSFTNN